MTINYEINPPKVHEKEFLPEEVNSLLVKNNSKRIRHCKVL